MKIKIFCRSCGEEFKSYIDSYSHICCNSEMLNRWGNAYKRHLRNKKDLNRSIAI